MTGKRNLFIPFLLLFIAGVSLHANDKLDIGSKAPDFSLPTIGAEKPVSLADFVNKKMVIVHFWKSR